MSGLRHDKYWGWILTAIAALGIVARVALSAVSVGSYDAVLWTDFAKQISERGLLELYESTPHFNHPPIPGLWALISYRVSQILSHVSFPFVFKLPMIAADAVACVLLWKIWSKRSSRTFAALVAAGFAWNLDAFLVSAYHCNTDPIYAMLALLAVYLVEDRRAFFLGGLTLGAAINVKLIPVVLIIPMIAGCRDRRELLRIIAGLALAVVPFVPVLIVQGPQFARNALGYASSQAYWGFMLFLRELTREPRFSGWAQPLMDGYHDLGRYVMILSIALVVLIARRRGVFDRYLTCAATAAMFLILTSGFGIQYTAFVGPLLFAVRPGMGALYGLLSGLYLLFAYWTAWFGGIPITSERGPDLPAPGPLFGLLAWSVLIVFVWNFLRCERK